MNDDKSRFIHSEITKTVLGCCFDVINELGSGFLEAVYKNAVAIALIEKGLQVDAEKRFDVIFHGKKIGIYIPDLIVNDSVVIELKCCEQLITEHQAQIINYLKVSGALVGLLVNFGRRKLEYKRLLHPEYPAARDPSHPVLI